MTENLDPSPHPPVRRRLYSFPPGREETGEMSGVHVRNGFGGVGVRDARKGGVDVGREG